MLRLLLVFAAAATAAAGASPRLTVVVSRHGVRTPFSPTGGDLAADSFSRYSHRAAEFPVTAEEWGVSGSVAGQPLTDHGKRVIERMGEYFRLEYPQLVGPSSSCADLFIYADDCLRDFQTAEQFMKGMVPGCTNKLNITHAESKFSFCHIPR